MTDRGQIESVPAPEDTVRKIQRLKKAIVGARAELAQAQPKAGLSVSAAAELSNELRQWEDQLEAIRCELAELVAEKDRWRIAHDKLRERLDRHTLEPRSEPQRKMQAVAPPPQPRSSSESQDFSVIDRELERLNASMLRAFSQE